MEHTDSQAEFRRLREWIDQSENRKGLDMVNAFWRQTKERLARVIRRSDVPIADTLRLVVFDHSDWVRCLGNALTRALRTELGLSLLNRLLEAGFVESGGHAVGQRNGLEIVRSIFDEGRLLELARMMPQWKEQILPARSLARDERSSYPQDVYGLVGILLRWHGALLEITGPPEPRNEPRQERRE